MNLIPKLAEMLGVEIGEEFKVKKDGFTSETVFRITESGTECLVDDEAYCDADSMFVAILSGQYEIVKLPFKPKVGENYYCVKWFRTTFFTETCNWDEDFYDYSMLNCGNCFRTKSEAEKHKYEIYEKLTGKRWEREMEQ